MNTAVTRDPSPVAWRLVIGLLVAAWILAAWLVGSTQGRAPIVGPIAAGGLAVLVGGIVWAVVASPWVPAGVAVAAGLAWLSPTLARQVPGALAEGVLATSLWPMDIALVLLLVVVLVRRDRSRVMDLTAGVLFVAALLVAVATVLSWDPFFSASCEVCRHADPIIEPGPDGRVAIRIAGDVVALAAGSTLALVSVWSMSLRDRTVGRLLLAIGGFTVAGSAVLMAVDDTGRAVGSHGIGSHAGISLTDAATQGLAIGAMVLAIGMIIIASGNGLTRRRLRLLAAAVARGPEVGAVGDAFAAALGDPGIRVAYLVGNDERLVDVDGDPCTIGLDERLTTLERAGRGVAVVIHGPASDVSSLTRELGAGMLVALDNERMLAARLSQLQELQESRQRIVEVADTERRRIERDLHDGAQQRLLAIAMDIRLARMDAERAAEVERGRRLQDAELLALTAIDELRRIARGVYPAILAQSGLSPALRSLADETAASLDLDVEVDERMPSPVEAAAYAVVAELSSRLVNDDGSHLAVRVRQHDARLTVDAHGAMAAPPTLLERLRDRVGAVGGQLATAAQPDGSMWLHVELPCA